MKRFRKRGKAVALALAAVMALPGWALAAPWGARPVPDRPGVASVGPGQSYVPGEVLVKYRSGVTTAALMREKSRLGVATKRAIGRNRSMELLRITGGASVEATIAALQHSGLVEYAEPNYIWRISAQAPNDPRFSDLWGLNNNTNPGIDIGALAAWDVTQGEPTVIVGVTDTGIDINHPDLRNNIWVNAAEANGQEGVDDDGNGYVDDVNGWDFHWNDNTVYDPLTDWDEQHGTHVAGTIAAEANNATGVAGVAPRVKIMPLKVCYWSMFCDNAAAVDAINYAIAKGVRVINASWGGPTYSQALYDAIAAFGQAGGIFVAAAGNGGLDGIGDDNDATPNYPASYNLPNIISVAAVDNAGNLADFSNFGPTSVDVGAPGVGILSTVPRVPDGPAAVTVVDATYGYGAVVWGFGAEYFTVQQAVYDAVYRAMDYLGVPPGADVLLVDDDESDSGRQWTPDVRDTYVSAMVYNGYNPVVYNVTPDMSGPDTVTMAAYQAVVWFTGGAFGDPLNSVYPLTVADQVYLSDYLKGGGKLFLSGQDALWGNETSSFLINDLHTYWLGEMGWSGRSHYGLAGTCDPFGGGAYCGADYTSQWAPVSGSYYDFLVPTDSQYGVDALTYVGDADYANAYDSWRGTSMATPHVAGVAALLLSHRPTATVTDVVYSIVNYTTPLSSLNGKTVSGGMVNAPKALAAVDGAPTLTVTATPSTVTAPGNVTITVYSDEALSGVPVVTVTPPGGSAQPVTMTGSGTNWAGTYAVTSSLPNGTYNVAASGTDLAGNPGSGIGSFTVSLDKTAPTLTVTTSPSTVTAPGDVTITVTSSEALSGAPTVTVTPPGGSAQPVTMTGSGTNWAGTYAVTSSSPNGTYNVAASGTDLAGNPGSGIGSFTVSLSTGGGGGGTGGGGGGSQQQQNEPQPGSGQGDAGDPISVKDPAGTYEMDVPAGAVEAGAGARVKVNVVPIAAAQVEELLKSTRMPEGVTSIGKAFEFKAEVTVDGKTQAVTTFAKPVTFTVNLSADDLKKAGDPEKIGVFRLNDDGTLTFVGGKLVNGKLVVQLYGFSRYVLAEVKVAFNDMKDHWARTDVELMGAMYVVKGLPGGGFDPGGAVTRAQFAAMLVRAMGLPAARTALDFKDVKGGAWYYGELATAVKAGLIQGFGDGTFRPDAPVTREQVAAMVARALRVSGKAAALGEAAAARALVPFADAGGVSSWAARDLALAIKEGILQGRTATSLAPATGASRAEAAAMIARFWRK